MCKHFMNDILNKMIVLVLNRNWQAINIRTPQEAFCQWPRKSPPRSKSNLAMVPVQKHSARDVGRMDHAAHPRRR